MQVNLWRGFNGRRAVEKSGIGPIKWTRAI